MRTPRVSRTAHGPLFVLLALLVGSACGDDGAGPVVNPTGATIRGRVVLFEPGQASVVPYSLAVLDEPGVTVTVGSKSTQTDAQGRFLLTDVRTGDQVLTLSKDGVSRTYLVANIEEGETFDIDGIEVLGGDVSTSHTGTWVGTGGSTEPGSQGQIAITMILEKNGNTVTGAIAGGAPDNSSWSIQDGTETGLSMEADFVVVVPGDECTSGGRLEGTFDADTLNGTFLEVNPPSGCGPPESGMFRVVKQ